jgi:hypothetical protein
METFSHPASTKQDHVCNKEFRTSCGFLSRVESMDKSHLGSGDGSPRASDTMMGTAHRTMTVHHTLLLKAQKEPAILYT